MRALLTVLAIFWLMPAAYATSTVTEPKWIVDHYRGTSIVDQHTADTIEQVLEACRNHFPAAEANTSQTSGESTDKCDKWRYFVRRTFTANPPPPPPPVDCVVSGWGALEPIECPITGQQTHSRTIVTPASNGGAACPPLTESVPCTYVPPPPPPPTGWTHIADEHESFNFSGTKRVRFGCATSVDASCTWVERDITDGGGCNTGTFGSDPAPGVLKTCDVYGGAEPLPTGTELLTWTPPTLSTSGQPLVGLVGYRIYYGQDPYTVGSSGINLQIPQATAWRVTGLAPGVWYFGVTALMGGGEQSGLSNIVRKEVN